MLHTFETRLHVTPELSELLSANASHWSWGLRKAWSLLYRQKLTKPQAYAALKKCEFTSKQVGSLLIAAEMKHAGLVELKVYERKQLELGIAKREQAIRAKQKQITSLQKRQARLQLQRNRLKPKAGQPRSKQYIHTLASLRKVDADLAFCKNWVRQKERVLTAKQGKLEQLKNDIANKRYSLCFGSKKLLSQRPNENNQHTTPFESVDAWRTAWGIARNGQWWSVGHTDKPSGNPEVQWLPETRQLRIRLADKLAHERMDARGVPRASGKQSDCPKRMQCRFIVIDDVDFTSHKGFAREALKDAFSKRPVTMRVIARLQDGGTLGWYVQASLDVPTGFQPETATDRKAGVLGLDFNAKGIAWCVVKPDGNRLIEDDIPVRGFIKWDLKGKTSAERKQVLGTAVNELVQTAQRLGLAVAIENLDFATKKLTMRAGAVNKRFNEMLGNLASQQFAELIERAAEKYHLQLYKVNPSYSSIGGWTKYGRLNRSSVDEAAAHWLGRQALFGTVWKTGGATSFIKKHIERPVFPRLPANRMQSMKALANVQWKDVALGLGKNRRLWGKCFHNWFSARVGATSFGPAGVVPMRDSRLGAQPGNTRSPGGAAMLHLQS